MLASQMGTNDNAYSLALISLKVHNIGLEQLAVYRLYDKLVNSTRIQEAKRCKSEAVFLYVNNTHIAYILC